MDGKSNGSDGVSSGRARPFASCDVDAGTADAPLHGG
jgi:hypothetical protein